MIADVDEDNEQRAVFIISFSLLSTGSGDHPLPRHGYGDGRQVTVKQSAPA